MQPWGGQRRTEVPCRKVRKEWTNGKTNIYAWDGCQRFDDTYHPCITSLGIQLKKLPDLNRHSRGDFLYFIIYEARTILNL